MPGKLVTFEGIDFSGKSVQASLLEEALKNEGSRVFFLREPGGTEISEKIRTVLLDNENYKMNAMTEVLLYSAARAQMVHEIIVPYLAKDFVVICDRYFDSTTAYQGYGRKIDLEFIEKLNNFATQSVIPELTFLIDLEPEVALKRKNEERSGFDRLEQEDLVFHRRVREGYLQIAQSQPDRFQVIDGRQTVESIHKEIHRHVTAKLKLKVT